MVERTHTVAVLNLSPAAHQEIKEAMMQAGYNHTFIAEGEDPSALIDMSGIAVVADPSIPNAQ